MKLGEFYARLMKYFDRGKLHWGNFAALSQILVLIKVYDDTAWGKWIFENELISMPLILVLFLGMMVGIGHLEYKYGLIEKQIAIDNKNNTMLQELLKRTKE